MKKKKLVVFTGEFDLTKNIGGICFKKCGEFVLHEDHMRVHICRTNSTDRHVVYAHVVDDKVVYIGESSDTLRNRLRLYLTHSGSTNVRVRKHIREELQKGKKAETYYYKPETIMIEGVLSVNPYVGIEQALIRMMDKTLNIKDVA